MTYIRLWKAQLFVTVFGIATRRALADYLRMVALIMFILLMTAWTIDLANHFPVIRRASETRDLPLFSLLAPYLTYRSADMITRLLPMACFFGVFLAEVARRARQESIVLAASGAGPVRMLASILWLGLILGFVQGAFEARWRPAAVMAQVELGYGDYAAWYRQGWMGASWFIEDTNAMRAEVLRSKSPELRNVLVFQGIRSPRLQGVIAAERAFPTSVPSKWILKTVYIWAPESGDAIPLTRPSMILEFDLIPEQLSYYGIQEFNIPTPPLMRIAARPTAPNAANIQTAVWRRRTVWIVPGAIALLALVLARAGFVGRVPVVPRLIAVAAIGYIMVVSLKVFWALGRLAVMPAPIATFAPIGIILALAAFVARRRA